MNNYQPKVTKSMRAVEDDLALGNCCETDCGISIIVDKDDVAQGRKQRCIACLMRLKMRQELNK
jgi:hypothetical protein